ncbi:hypothetical protein ACFWU3_14965 [Streptomyces sp. NPDC058685]|uniref:hypothetical protein n=1 Tax=Streptomyces sp. NPDC058685 TaxID=3346598 RepID=UPI00364DDFF5
MSMPKIHLVGLTPPGVLASMRASHPAPGGVQSAMQTIKNKPPRTGSDLLPVLAGAAFAVSGVGVALALADVRSPLRAPFVLFFLFAGPACGLFAALSGFEPAVRAAIAAAGAVGIGLLAALPASSPHILDAGGGVVAVAAITALLFLWAPARRMRNPGPGRPSDQFLKAIKKIRSGSAAFSIRFSAKK